MPEGKAGWKTWARDKEEFKNLPLTYVAYQDISLVLGSDAKHLRLPERHIWDQNKEYLAFQTALGWCMSGPVFGEQTQGATSLVALEAVARPGARLEEIGGSLASLDELAKEFKIFNRTELSGITDHQTNLSIAEERDLKRMEASLTYTEEGRPCVPMLWKNFSAIPESEGQARHRLALQHKKWQRTPEVRALVDKNIMENLEKGYVR